MAIIKTAQFGHGTVDMEFLGLSMEKQPQILQELIVSRFAHLPLTTLFSGIYGESVEEDMVASNMVRWKVYGLPNKPVYIQSSSGSFRTGQDSTIVVNDSQYYPGAVVQLEDGQSQLYVKGARTANVVNGVQAMELTVQPVSNNELDVIDSSLLTKGKALNYIAANYEEASETGHPIAWGTGDHYVQALEIIRHKLELTGDALTQAITMEIPGKDRNGNPKLYKGYLPNIISNSGQSLIDAHMEAVERSLVWGKGNFDPSTGKIYNTASNGRPVLKADGLVRQFDGSYTTLFHPTDTARSIRQAIQRMLTQLSYATGQDTIDLVIIGGTGAKLVWNDAMADLLQTNGQHVMLNAEKSPKTVAGLDVTTFTTPFGSIKFVTSQSFNNPTRITQMINYNGTRLPAESFDMHAFPIQRMSNGKMNIRIFSKAKQAGGKMVNRSLVFGHIQGMTGWGLTAKQQGELAQYSNMVSTGRDAEQFEVLSQKGLIVTNPAECSRLLVMRS